MPVDLAKLLPRVRTVEIGGIGPLVFREPTMGDYQRSQGNPYWWVGCITCPDGTPFLANAADIANISGELASALLEEVNRPRPTAPPSGGCSESQAPSSA